MATIGTLTTDFNLRFNDTAGRFLTTAMAESFLNIANREFDIKTEFLVREYGFASVANQWFYAVPSDIVKPVSLMYMYGGPYRVTYKPIAYFADHGGFALWQKSRPVFFTLQDADKKLRLWPTPSAGSPATTINQVGGINSSDTSVIVTDATNLRAQGMVSIENEQIVYYAKSGNTLQQLVRGFGGTAAASHADGKTVTAIDFHLWYVYVEGTLATGDSPAIPAQYHDDLVIGAMVHALRADNRDNEAQIFYQHWERKLAQAKAEAQRRQRDTMLAINDIYGW